MPGNQQIANIAFNRMKNRNLDKTIKGSYGYLDKGIHEVVIHKIDLTEFESKALLKITFRGITGAIHIERVYCLKYNNKDHYHPSFVALVDAIFMDHHIYKILDELFSDTSIQELVFKAFEGTRIKITLNRTEGYRHANDGSKLVIVDALTGELLDTHRFDSVHKLREVASTKGLERSKIYITRYEELADDILAANRKHFDSAIEGISQATKACNDARQIFNINKFIKATETE